MRSRENFAKLFRPKSGLLNKVLELSIDDLVYSSFPFKCPISKSGSSKSGVDRAEPGSASSSSSNVGDHGSAAHMNDINANEDTISSQSSEDHVVTMLNIVVTSVTFKAMKRINPDAVYRCCQQKRPGGGGGGGGAPAMMRYVPGDNPVTTALGLCFDPLNNAMCTHVIRR